MTAQESRRPQNVPPAARRHDASARHSRRKRARRIPRAPPATKARSRRKKISSTLDSIVTHRGNLPGIPLLNSATSARRMAHLFLIARGQCVVQPGPRVGPIPLGGGRGDIHRGRGLLHRQTGEIAEFDEIRLGRRLDGQLGQASSKAKRSSDGAPEMEHASSKSTRGRSPPCLIRCLRRAVSTKIRRMASAAAAKKWPRLFQCCALVDVDQPEIGLVHQGRGLQRLPRLLLGQFLRGQLPQFVVDQRQKLLGGSRIALFDLG